jgi:uncharacterized protein YqeY
MSDINIREDLQKNLVQAMKAKDKNKVEVKQNDTFVWLY